MEPIYGQELKGVCASVPRWHQEWSIKAFNLLQLSALLYIHPNCMNGALFQGSREIPSKQIGYVLRILGQNPTEDDIVEMVMKVWWLNKAFLTAKVTIQQAIRSICVFVCLCHSWNSSFKRFTSQSEHSLRLTNQSEDSILSAVSADISCSIKTQ